jgi:uncharacterized protein YkwD
MMRMSATFVRSGLYLILIGLASCSHGASRASQVTNSPSDASGAGTTPQRLVIPEPSTQPSAPTVFMPTGTAASSYGGAPLPAQSTSVVENKLRQSIVSRCIAAGFPAPQFDGRLDLVAAELANQPSAISHELVSFLSHHYGLAEPQPNLLSVGTDGSDVQAIGLVMKQAEQSLQKSAWPRLGLAAVRKGQYLQVIVLLGIVDIAFDAFPRTLSAKQTSTLQGQLPKGFDNAQLVVTTPAGITGRLPITVRGPSFKGTFSCLAGAGRYDVELMAEAKRGPEVMLNAPVFCGVSPPLQFSLNKEDEFRNATTSQEVEIAMVTAINRERAKRDQTPLEVDERLRDVARVYAEEMARLQRVAHITLDGQSAVDRVRRVGLSPTLLAENVGSATVSSAVHEGFMSSPGHRANVLEPMATHLGVGVAQVKSSADGPTVWYVTELFARFSPLQPPEKPRTKQR